MNDSLKNQIKQMVKSGATRGMVKVKFQDSGATAEEIDKLYTQAVKGHKTGVRSKSLGILIAGIAIVALGIGWITLNTTQGSGGIRTPVIIIIVGVVVAFRGFASMLSGIAD